MGCRSIKIEGIENITVNQGVDVDLMDGVHAYDSNLDEIDVSVSPSEIDSCDVGTHTVTYKATGVDDGQFGVTTCVEPLLHAPNLCNYRTIQKSRTIEVLSVVPPMISGIDDESIEVGGSLDLLSGVSAIDANGNTVDVSYSGEINELASGEIASFETDLAKPLQSLTVNLDPIQDLNGYDAPWVGGAGKNVFQPFGGTGRGIVFTPQDDGTVKISGTVTQSGWPQVQKDCTIEELGWSVGDEFYNYVGSNEQIGFAVRFLDGNGTQISQISSNASGAVPQGTVTVRFIQIGARYTAPSVGDVINTVGHFYLCKGATAPTEWTPYSNICPISGHTDVVTQRTGVNVWDEEWRNGYYNASTGEFAPYATQIANTNPISVKPNTVYALAPRNTTIRFVYLDANKEVISVDNASNSITTPSNCYYINFNMFTQYGGTYNNDISINYPSTDHDYHAYEGDTYTATLPETVYGGTVDLVSGVLTVDRAMVDMGSLDWRYNGVVPNGYQYAVAITNKAVGETNFVCSAYATGSPQTTLGYICGRASTTTVACNALESTVADFIASVSSQQLVYELANPQTYQLTPQQINTLLGQNNVWSEQGSVAVVYARSIQNRSETFDVEGLYEITYTAEDKCGNERTSVRTITVGDLSSTE